jgi:hypothetical protein
MFTFFGLGAQELVVLLVVGLLLAGCVLFAIVASLSLSRRLARWDEREVAELRSELERLRREGACREDGCGPRGPARMA